MEPTRCHRINPRKGHPHTHTIIFLHGRDSTAEEFASEIFESEASDALAQHKIHHDSDTPGRTLPDLLPTVKWVFPSAPILKSARFDTDMSQWFDIWSVEDPSEQKDIQIAGLRDSIAYINGVIESEAALVLGGRSSIFLGGISQGFATAISTFLSGSGSGFNANNGEEECGQFAGVIGLSSWLPFIDEVEEYLKSTMTTTKQDEEAIRVQMARYVGQLYSFGSSSGSVLTDDGNEENGRSVGKMLATPVLIGHCKDDEVVPMQNGEKMARVLGGFMKEVDWHLYEDGGHWLNEPRGVDDLVQFIRRNM